MLKKLLSLLSDAAIYGVSSALSQLISFILLPILARKLSPADYGVLGMLTIVYLVFLPMASIGMPSALFRRFNAEKDPRKRGEVLSTALASAVVFSLILLIISVSLSSEIAVHVVGALNTTHLVEITLVSAAIATISGIALASLRAVRRVKTIAALTLLKLLMYVAASIYFVIYLNMGVRGAVLGTFVAEVFYLFVQFAVNGRSFLFKPSYALWRTMAAYGAPIVPHALQAVALAWFGQYVVRGKLGLADAGLYNMATKFAVPAAFVVNSVQASWTAFKFQVHSEDDDSESFFRSTLTYYAAGTCYLWVGLSAWGPELLRVLTPPVYHPAAFLVPAAAFVPLAQGIYFMMGTGIELSDNTRPFPLISFLGLVTVVGGTYAIVPHFGGAGALIVTGVGWLVMAVCAYRLAQRRVLIRYDWASVRAAWMSAVVVVALIYALQTQPLAMRVSWAIVISVVYPFLMLLILFRSPHEQARVRILRDKFRSSSLARGRSE